jgi:DNA invertase Pin-like site-specific DNA recombinase
LTENIDTTTAGGRLIFHVFGALAEFERELILGRSRAGTAAARARGRVGGRPTVMTWTRPSRRGGCMTSGS